jgi:FemAB family protein
MYTNSSIEFQLAYQQGHGGDWQDLSMVIYWDSKPTAVWPLSLSEKDGKTALSSHGLPVHPPLFAANCSPSSRKRIVKSCLELADAIAVKAGVSGWESTESFADSIGLSDWHSVSMARGAACAITHDLFIDLRQSMEEIKSGFRKSYKSLITSGLRHWTVGVLDTADEAVWDRFHDLHVRVAGRKTRSDDTWAIHHRDIVERRGFLVYLSNGKGEMDGAGFFNCTRDEGLYAVAAYRRDLFDKPLGHIVQYRAIEELKRREVRWYKLGVRPYNSETPMPSAKEVAIGEFKQGFASHMFPRYRVTHAARGVGTAQERGRVV